MRAANKRVSTSDRIVGYVNAFLLTVMTAIFCVPLLNVLANSFSLPENVMNGRVWLLPKGFYLEGYQKVFEVKELWMGYANSLVIMVMAVCIALVMTTLAAYPLSKKTLPGRGFLITLFTIPMFIGGGLIPGYVLIKDLGMLDTFWALVLPGISPTYIMIIKTFWSSNIPNELYEAAELDGAHPMYTLLKIVLPLSTAVLAVFALYIAVGQWNSYFAPMIYLQSPEKATLQMVLKQYVLSGERLDMMLDSATGSELEKLVQKLAQREVMKYCIIVVAMLPMIIIYPFVQKHFAKGVMVGSVKG